MKQLRFIVLVLMFGISCQKDEPVATNGNIAGRVTDKVSNEPISGAAVTVKGNQITTGSDGTFAVNDIYADTYQISVSKLGYVSDSKSVVVSPEKTSRADFSLSRLLPAATPTSLAFDRENLERSLTLENKQSEKLSYTLEASKSWISANPQSGTIESSNQKIITVTIDPQTLEYGTYNETLIVNVAASSLSIPIAFIYEQDSYISITSPETDGVYKMGEIMSIQWDSNLNGKVSIELLRSSSTMLEIASEVENNDGGNYSWEIPALDADAYILKISSVEYPDITTQSGAFLLEEGPTKPVVATGETTEVTVNTIKIKGVLESLGIQASEVSQYGHVYSKTNELPTIADDRTNLGSTTSTGEYESLISGLVPGDSYYIRAYAINQKGAAYGDVKLISTVIGAPALTTGVATDIMQTKATLSASLDSSGGGTVSERGIIWGDTAPLNNESNTVVADGVQEGEYSVDLTSLSPGTTYYYKAYAINPNGIGYGEQKSFRTYGTEATIYTLDPNNILATKFTARGRIDSNGGESLTSYGFVYATSENPTLENEKVEVGATDFTGEFNIEINNLTPSTVYFVRSYATNSIGTVYGDQKSITTLSGTPQAETTEITSFNAISATVKGKIISDAGEELLAYGIVYSTDDNPTIDDTKVEASQNTNGVFTITLDELSPSTKYYVRAFVSNVVDTGYGEVLTFTTENGLATVSTDKMIDYNSFSATVLSKVIDDKGIIIKSYGVVYSTSASPTIQDLYVEGQNITDQQYTILIENLSSQTKYYVRSYVENEEGYSYGNQLEFTTTNGLPRMDELNVSNLNYEQFTVSINLISMGDSDVTEMGVVYSQNPNPTIYDLRIKQESIDVGTFSLLVENLQENTQYFVRPYAINQQGVYFGNIVEVKTEIKPTVNITYPSINSILTIGRDYNIQWTTNYFAGLGNIYLVLDGEEILLEENYNLSSENYTWNISNSLNNGNAIIKIYDIQNNLSHESDSFKISNRIYIPDDVLEQELINLGFDDILDDYIEPSQADLITELSIINKGIISIEGINQMSNLKTLDISNNYNLESVVISNQSITKLYLDGIQKLKEIEFSLIGSNNLEVLSLNNCGFIDFDFSENISFQSLKELYISGNNYFTDSEMSFESKQNNILEKLVMSQFRGSLLDISNLTSLLYLDVSNTTIPHIDISKNLNLETFLHGGNIKQITYSSTKFSIPWGDGDGISPFTKISYDPIMKHKNLSYNPRDNQDLNLIEYNNKIYFASYESISQDNYSGLGRFIYSMDYEGNYNIVAGGNGDGTNLNQLDDIHDFDIYDNNLFVLDVGNNRLVKWTIGDDIGEIINVEGLTLNDSYTKYNLTILESGKIIINKYKSDSYNVNGRMYIADLNDLTETNNSLVFTQNNFGISIPTTISKSKSNFIFVVDSNKKLYRLDLNSIENYKSDFMYESTRQGSYGMIFKVFTTNSLNKVLYYTGGKDGTVNLYAHDHDNNKETLISGYNAPWRSSMVNYNTEYYQYFVDIKGAVICTDGKLYVYDSDFRRIVRSKKLWSEYEFNQ